VKNDVLLVTASLEHRSGTDVATRDLASALLRAGWRPIVFASRSGAVAEEIRRATIPVIDDLATLHTKPALIHGNHGFELVAAMMRWPDVPALFVCHDALAWHSVPPSLSRVRRVVAVDENCRDRVVLEHGIPPDRVHVLTNAVDLQRFAPRAPLPPKPKRALVFSNVAREATFVAPIREACVARGIDLDVAGRGAGRIIDNPEKILADYDLVFAKARCALEALAVGCGVVVCDERGLATYVDSFSVEHMRRLNFGARTLQRPITATLVGEEIDRYDAADAAKTCEIIRASAGVDLLARQFIDLYDEVIAEGGVVDRDQESIEVSNYMQRIAAMIFRSGDIATPSASARIVQRLARSRRLAPLLHRLYRVLEY